MPKTPQMSEPLDLVSAASIGAYGLIDEILRNNLEDVNKVNCSGWTPVMYAANYGHFNVIRLLIRNNCDVNQRDWQGRTALMLAASNGHTRCIDVLINYGKADKTLKDVTGTDAYKYAKNCGHGNNKLIRTLLLKTEGYELKGRSFMAPTPASSPVTPNSSKKDVDTKILNEDIYNPCEPTVFSGSQRFWRSNSSQVSDGFQSNGFSDSSTLEESKDYIVGESTPCSSDSDGSMLSSSQSSFNSSIISAPKTRRKPTGARNKCAVEQIVSPVPKSLFHLLTRIELIQYLDLFESNGIDFNQFLTLTDSDFQKLGINSFGHRKKLSIAQLRYHESLDISNTQESFLADYLLNERDSLNQKINRLEERLRDLLKSNEN